MVKEKYQHWKAVILSIYFLILHEILYGEHENGLLDSCPLGESLVLSSALIHVFSDPLSFSFVQLKLPMKLEITWIVWSSCLLLWELEL